MELLKWRKILQGQDGKQKRGGRPLASNNINKHTAIQVRMNEGFDLPSKNSRKP